jgi:D-psicose/D-tagatose/L-ribulose 3-epimerase
MKIGINILLWTTRLEKSHGTLLESLKSTGYDGVEIPVFSPDIKYCREIAQFVKSFGLEMTAITSMTPESNPCNPDPKIRAAALEHLKGVLDSAAELGTSVLGGPFHSCFKEFTKKRPTDDELKLSSEVMRGAAEYAEQYKIELAPEALNRFECYLVNTAENARKLAAYVDHPLFGYHHDTHHANIEEKNTGEAIRASAKEIRHVHISENDRGTPGKGQVPWEGVFSGLQAIGYDRWLTIEAFVSTVPDFSEHINVWRDASSQEEIYQEGFKFSQEQWKAHSKKEAHRA